MKNNLKQCFNLKKDVVDSINVYLLQKHLLDRFTEPQKDDYFKDLNFEYIENIKCLFFTVTDEFKPEEVKELIKDLNSGLLSFKFYCDYSNIINLHMFVLVNVSEVKESNAALYFINKKISS